MQMFVQALDNAVHASSDIPEGEGIEVITRVQTGRPGRPRFQIDRDTLAQALELRNQTDIAEEWGVSYKTIHRAALDYGLIQPGQHPFQPPPALPAPPQPNNQGAVAAVPHRQSRARGRRELNDEELANLVQECFTLFQRFGGNMLSGFMASRGVYASRDRLEATALRINGVPRLFGDRIERRVYAVAGPNALWHHDGQHGKLPWIYSLILIRTDWICSFDQVRLRDPCIHQRFSRLVIRIRVHNNNGASSDLDLFLDAMRVYGIPRRVRETSVPDHHRLHRTPAPTHIELDVSERRPRSSSDSSRKSTSSKSATIILSPHMLPALTPNTDPSAARAAPLGAPMISLSSAVRDAPLSPIPQSPISNESTPIPISLPRRSATIDHGAPASRENDYFSLRGARSSFSQTPGPIPTSPDDFSSWGTPSLTPKPGDLQGPLTPSTPSAGGLMGRLRAFGKGGRRQTTEFQTGTPGPQPAPDTVMSPSVCVVIHPIQSPLMIFCRT